MTLLLKGKLIAVFLLLIAVDCYSQNEMLSEAIYYQNRNKIVEVFGEEFLANNNELIAVYDRIISDNIHYHLIPLASDEKYPLLSSYSLNNKVNPMVQAIDFGQFNPETFNPLYYALPFFSNTTVAVRVDNTDYVIVIDALKR